MTRRRGGVVAQRGDEATAAAAPRLPPAAIGHEARAADGDHQSLRLWLRLLACTNQIETELRRRLHAGFGMSLSRFDCLAQLHRHPEGLGMTALSGYLMVTGGSVTGLTRELEREGLVARRADPHDRRASTLSLTAAGRRTFERIAAAHESWVVALLGGLGDAEREHLAALLTRVRASAAARAGAGATPADASGARRRRTPPKP